MPELVRRCLYAGSLVLGCHAAALAQGYTYTVISPPGATQTMPVALSAAGTVLGYWYDSSNDIHGFLYQNGGYKQIDYPNAIYTQPSGFNDKGEIVGSYTGQDHQVHAFVYQNGAFKNFSVPGSSEAGLVGVNNAGVILGAASGEPNFVYENGVYKPVATQNDPQPVEINNVNAVIGNYYPPLPAPISAYLRQGTSLLTLPINSSVVESYGVNDSTDVVGIEATGNTFEGFIYSKGAVKTFNYPQASGTYAESINNLDAITGYYTDVNYNEFGFVLSNGHFVSLSAPNAAGTYGLAINDAGEVLGGYHDVNRVQYTFIATPSN